MRKIEFKLSTETPNTNEEFFREDDTNILIQVSRSPSNMPMSYTLQNDRGRITRNGTGNLYCIRLQRQEFDSMFLEGICTGGSNAKGFIYIGTWAEILICDIYINLNLLYQTIKSGQVGFQIGLNNQTNLTVDIDNSGNFRVVRTLTMSRTEVYTQHETIDAGSETATHIKQIYGRINENLANESFAKRQVADAERLQRMVFDFLQNY